MQEKLTPLSQTDRDYLEQLRNWVRNHFKEGERGTYDQIDGKLFAIYSILKNGWLDPNDAWQLHALGVGFGDAVAQKLGLSWVIVEDDWGKSPILQLPGTSLKLTMIEKSVRNGEDIDVFAMFGAVCEQIEQVRAPKRSFLGRLFGERLT